MRLSFGSFLSTWFIWIQIDWKPTDPFLNLCLGFLIITLPRRFRITHRIAILWVTWAQLISRTHLWKRLIHIASPLLCLLILIQCLPNNLSNILHWDWAKLFENVLAHWIEPKSGVLIVLFPRESLHEVKRYFIVSLQCLTVVALIIGFSCRSLIKHLEKAISPFPCLFPLLWSQILTNELHEN